MGRPEGAHPKSPGELTQCGAGQYGDGGLRLIGTRDLPGDSATLRFSATLDQGADDEAWGLDTVLVQVR